MGYTNYIKSGKPQSSSKIKIINKENSGGKEKIDVSAEVFDNKNKSTIKFDYSVWCDGSTFYIDMKSTLGTLNMKDLGNFKIESTNMQFPAHMEAGQSLPDASISLKMDGPVNMGVSTQITNRKVVGNEKVTTPAGTFDCIKISYDLFSKVSFIKTEGHAVEWYAPNTGLVRSETYDKKNKLTGYNELTSFTN